jgi:RsiW-degrading membrane proteinase PrsW (M82 family)
MQLQESVVMQVSNRNLKTKKIKYIYIYYILVMALGWYFMAVELALCYYDKLKQRSPSWTTLASSALSGLVVGVLYG